MYSYAQQNKLIIEKEKAIKEKSSEDGKRLKNLLDRNKNAHDGVIWLRQNKTMFKGEVHEPIMMVSSDLIFNFMTDVAWERKKLIIDSPFKNYYYLYL